MAWEIEYEHVDKAEGVHRFGLIERSVITRDGAPQRHEFRIRLGYGADGVSCPHCGGSLPPGHELKEDGRIVDRKTGKEVVPRKLALEHLAKLNTFHAGMDAYAKRHQVKHYTGPAK